MNSSSEVRSGLCTMLLATTIATLLISLKVLSAPVTTIDAFFDPNGLEVAPEDLPHNRDLQTAADRPVPRTRQCSQPRSSADTDQ